ncbi:uncharacterized protein LOC115928539 [Strongylocentrotus purpuratus]|uniref:SET domain-containing protein n=1 Tax=Strongylocentrotus purpuratus TaxID=7668 RepID=A0A7M7PJN4_STRPU|nr:uncharacterized protein LOC115928539 [Strongylocentrotus purpuratus]
MAGLVQPQLAKNRILRSQTRQTVPDIFSEVDPEGFTVKQLPDKGRAVFTTKTFEEGEFLLWYRGDLVTRDVGERRDADCETCFRYFFTWKGTKWCRDASVEPTKQQLGRLVNHGWRGEVNSRMKIRENPHNEPELVLFSLKKIKEGEEVLYDYGVGDNFVFPSPTQLHSGVQDEKPEILQNSANLPPDPEKVCSPFSEPATQELLEPDGNFSQSNVRADDDETSEDRCRNPPNNETNWEPSPKPATQALMESDGKISQFSVSADNDDTCDDPCRNPSNNQEHWEPSPEPATQALMESDGKLSQFDVPVDNDDTCDDPCINPPNNQVHWESFTELATQPLIEPDGNRPLSNVLTDDAETSDDLCRNPPNNETNWEPSPEPATQALMESDGKISQFNVSADNDDTCDDPCINPPNNQVHWEPFTELATQPLMEPDGNLSLSNFLADNDDTSDDLCRNPPNNREHWEPFPEPATPALMVPDGTLSQNIFSSDNEDILSDHNDDSDDDPDYVCDSQGDSDSSGKTSLNNSQASLPKAKCTSINGITRSLKSLSSDQSLEASSRYGGIDADHEGITVMKTNNQGGRKYDKVAYCMMCEKPHKKLPDHLRSQHSNEIKVAQYMAATNRKEKDKLLTLIRNKGNHMHNYRVFEKGHGELVVVYRPSCEAKPRDYQPCKDCLGWFAKAELWKHRCILKQEEPAKEQKKKRRRLLAQGRLLLPPVPCTSRDSITHKVLSGLSDDEIKACILNDQLILELAKVYSKKLGHDEEQHNHIRCKLRELGRLVLQFRRCSCNGKASLTSLISPNGFMTVLSAVKKVAGFDEENHLFNTPSLALKLGHTLRKAAFVLLSKALMDRDGDDMQKLVEKFIKLLDTCWGSEISTHALRTLYQRKRNQPKLLPLTSDVVALSRHLEVQAELCVDKLSSGTTIENHSTWRELNKTMLAHLIVFNRRRQGEISKMTLDDYNKIKKGESHMVEGQLEMLKDWEKNLVKFLWRVEVVGKRGRTVPILVTDSMKSCVDTLVSHREEAGVNPSNKYLFAVANSDTTSHVRGSDALRELSEACGAQNPSTLRSTKLRKHVATMSQLMSLRDHEMDALANFMGHDIRIHREYYRLPDAAMQVAKISKILFAMEGKAGNPVQLIGTAKSLDELQIKLDEEIDTGEQGPESCDDNCDSDVDSGDHDVERQLPGCSQKGTKRQRQTQHVLEEVDEQPIRKKRKTAWSDAEKSAVQRRLGAFMTVHSKLPGKRAIDECLKAEAVLKHRTWVNIKDYVRNSKVTKSRKTQPW